MLGPCSIRDDTSSRCVISLWNVVTVIKKSIQFSSPSLGMEIYLFDSLACCGSRRESKSSTYHNPQRDIYPIKDFLIL